MIGGFVTSPLGIAVVILVAAIFLGALSVADRAHARGRAEARAAARRAVRRAPRRPSLARTLFHEAGSPGRPGCPQCAGDGGRLVLFPVPDPFPVATLIPILEWCPLCAKIEAEGLALLLEAGLEEAQQRAPMADGT